MLNTTKFFGLIVDTSSRFENLKILFAGMESEIVRYKQKTSKNWAIYLPASLEEITQHEIQFGMQLNPQLRQILLRANGASDDFVCPFFSKLELIQKQ